MNRRCVMIVSLVMMSMNVFATENIQNKLFIAGLKVQIQQGLVEVENDLCITEEEKNKIDQNFEKHKPQLQKCLEEVLARPGMQQTGQIWDDFDKARGNAENYEALCELMNNKDIQRAVLDALRLFEQTHRECLDSDETGMFCFKQSVSMSMKAAEFVLNRADIQDVLDAINPGAPEPGNFPDNH